MSSDKRWKLEIDVRELHTDVVREGSLAEWWLSHRYRNEVASVSYRPGESALYFAESDSQTLQTLNKFPGFVVEPDGGQLYSSLGELGDLAIHRAAYLKKLSRVAKSAMGMLWMPRATLLRDNE